MAKFSGQINSGSCKLDYYQTPDGQKGPDGQLLRPQARYSKEKGYDSAQQDNAFILSNAPDLREEDLKAFFKKASNELNSNASFKTSGTTATVAHVSKEGILTVAHVGDSPVNVYIRNPRTGKIVENYLVMSHLHNSKDIWPEEKERVEKAGGFIDPRTQRLDGILMMTRALGDHSLPGVTAEPEISFYDLTQHLDQGYEVIVTVETDGASEKTSEAQRIERLNKTASDPDCKLSRQLVDLADDCGTKDNITSIALCLKAPPPENIMMAVMDGHGPKGATAAYLTLKHLSYQFDPSLRAIRPVNADVEVPPKQPPTGMPRKPARPS